MSTYIKLEDVQKIFNKYNISPENGIIQKINSLPSIDFKEIIDSVEDTVYVNWLLYVNAPELLNKLPK